MAPMIVLPGMPLDRRDGMLWERLVSRTVVDEETGCWIWTGALNSSGYPVVRFRGKMVLLTRLSYWLTKGPIPKGKVICHSCDRPPCWFWDHLSAGSYSRNLREAWRRGRRKPISFLTDDF